jgi:hypothetical protein
MFEVIDILEVDGVNMAQIIALRWKSRPQHGDPRNFSRFTGLLANDIT